MLDPMLEAVMAEMIGFKRKKVLADEFRKNRSPEDSLQAGKEFFRSEEYQIRCFAVFLIGNTASILPEALVFLKNIVSPDSNWRVQEILGMAFAQYYDDSGYVKASAEIHAWLSDKNPNLRRAVTEGLRPWQNRDYFKDHVESAVHILSGFKDDESEYVRKSAGNALKDIGRKYPDLILKETGTWDLTDKRIRQTQKHALKLILQRKMN